MQYRPENFSMLENDLVSHVYKHKFFILMEI